MGVSGSRYYSASQGRFLGRDTIEEQGGLNLYGFVRNDGINKWDVLGMGEMEGWQYITIQNADGSWSISKGGSAPTGWDVVDAGIAGANNQNWMNYASQAMADILPSVNFTSTIAANRAGTSTSPTGDPVQTVVIPGQGTLVINKYDGGAGKNGFQLTLDFDFNHSGGKDAYGVLQTVTTDTFQKIKTPYADPINGPKYYTDGITMVPRPDPSSPVYDLQTGTMIPGFQMLPSTADGVLRFQDSPTNPISSTPLYGTLGFQTVIVTRPSDTPVVTITWGYSNQSSGFVKQPIVITPDPGP